MGATPGMKPHHNGALMAMMDQYDRNVISTDMGDGSRDSSGKSRKVRVEYVPRLLKSAASNTVPTGCPSGNIQPPAEQDIVVNQFVKSETIKITNEDLALVRDRSPHVLARKVDAMIKQAEGRLSDLMATDLVGHKGQWADGTTAEKTFNLFHTADGGARPRGYAQMLSSLRNSHFVGTPNIIGAGKWYELDLLTNPTFAAENNNAGVRPQGMRMHNLYYDETISAQLETGNEDNALVIEDHTTIPIFYNAHTANSPFYKRDEENEICITVPSPTTGLTWDLWAKYTSCDATSTPYNRGHWDAYVFLSWDIFTLDSLTGLYKSGDSLENTNGIYHIKATES